MRKPCSSPFVASELQVSRASMSCVRPVHEQRARTNDPLATLLPQAAPSALSARPDAAMPPSPRLTPPWSTHPRSVPSSHRPPLFCGLGAAVPAFCGGLCTQGGPSPSAQPRRLSGWQAVALRSPHPRTAALILRAQALPRRQDARRGLSHRHPTLPVCPGGWLWPRLVHTCGRSPACLG